ncbi:hypothetical protein GOBAR_AA13354 [Gossypium barbadense]|uniref:Uncharacterized protein n=1 Tax=Gossypium barbadense TaxID=3634 RepID=A0A2P5XVB5_GOSBA|nr:hypothetical protein GOBAR_AA13354 [Gossypium barbadense]
MAEVLLGAILEEAVSKANSIATKQISCICNFKEELERLGDSLEIMKAFLQDAEEKQTKKNAVKLWLQRLKDVADQATDILVEFDHENFRRKLKIRNQIGRKVLDFLSPNNSILFRLKMANKIKGILKTLDDLNKLATDFGLQERATDPDPEYERPAVETDSILPRSIIVGREADVSKIVDLLVNPKDNEPLSVVPIVGVGGLGKTTIAKLVYNDLNVKNHFDHKFWVCVSHHLDVKKILEAMFENFPDYSSTSVPETMDAMIMNLKEKFKQAKGEKEQIKYLLVLDDVWDVEKWDELKDRLEEINEYGRNGVIVTTRKEAVASAVQVLSNQTHQPGRLEDEECWSIIKQLALTPSPMSHSLEPIGKEIAKQCRGVPLLAKVIGGTMSKERSRHAWSEIKKSGVWGSPDSVLVESVLKFSFDRLSSPSLKKCFSYCAMFPKDCCFEKEELVQLWLAEGFLGSSMAMVDIGDKYLNELLSNSLFQDVEKDKFGNILTFKMHDILHELALSISKSDTLIFQENSTSTTNECSHIRHLNVGCDGESLPEILTAVAPKVYSLFSEIDVFKKLSKRFTRLRVLKFVGATIICELPDSLGELKHLRYLDISKTSIRELPKSTIKLYNLQTLRLLGLPLFTFPDGLENLNSLKHLHFTNREVQPDNIGNLICLQTLPIFFVGSERGRSIEEDKQEANGANLRLKEKLCKVIVDFEGSDSGNSGYNSEEVMEVIYQGNSFPSWMLRPGGDSNTGLFLLNHLVELNFFNCINCESLPPLGQLCDLQFLELRNLKKVKRMGNEFYCNEGIDGMNKVIKVFPALKKFTLSEMKSLEEWTAMATTKTIMFPCLEELNIRDCPLLKSVPLTGQCSSLEKLSISFCEKLSKIGNGLSTSTCLKELHLHACPNLSSIPNLEGFSSLQNLSIENCKKLGVLPIIGGCSSLEKLRISGCEKLSKIGDGLSTSTCLKELGLFDCPNLSSIPNLEGLSSLQNLSIYRCKDLGVLPIIGGCSSLEKLRISGCEKLSKIGYGLSTSTCLKEFGLSDCPNVSSIPNLEGFSSLQYLSIESCKKLGVLPITGGCSSLQKLKISGCEKLSKIGDGLSTSTCLRKLDLKYRPNLSSIPNLKRFSSLQNLSIERCKDLGVLPIIGGCSSLEKLRISGCEKLSKIGYGLSTSTCLKEFGLSDCPNVSSIPNLEGFSSLQYLSIESCKKLGVLPITGGCSSLQKLKISGCEKLSKIGDGLSTSTCLRKLDLKYRPNLSSIPNLKRFSSLQNLSIERCKKLEVLPITGECSSLEELSIIVCEKLSKIGDGLSTSTCLKKLRLCNCPNLILIPELKGFSSLQNLSIRWCSELEVLPITGGCSSLIKLSIFDCKKLSKIGDGLSTSTCLKELDLKCCPNLSSIPNLEGFSSLQNVSVGGCDKLESFPLKAPLSSLKELSITDCPNLKPIPSLDGLSSLTELEFNKVGEGWSCLLPNMLRSNTSLCCVTTLNLPDLIWIPDDSLGRLDCLGKLTIGGFSEELREFPCLSSIRYLSASLQVLKLIGWETLKSLPHQFQLLTTLEDLTIERFGGIEALPDWLGNLSSLRRLYLSGFGKLKSLPHQLQLLTALEDLTMLGFHEIEALPEWLGNLSSLRHLYLSGFRKLKSFTHQLQLLSTLEYLTIEEFQGIEALPQSFRNLSSLRRLCIRSCKKLMYLPSVDVMRSLSKLQRIDIANCSRLETRCERGSGPEWSKISHIPRIYINGQRI